jgi:hypothetical protein
MHRNIYGSWLGLYFSSHQPTPCTLSYLPRVTKESGSSKDASAGSHSSPPIEGSPQANNDDEDVVDDGSEDEDEDEDELYRRNRAKSKVKRSKK